jgi:magnesium-transporting ATPase (P-type)
VYFKENGRSLTRAIFSYFVISLAIWLIITSILIAEGDSFHWGLQIPMFEFIAIIGPTLAAAWFYGRMNKPERQISFLVIPATHFEKHLLATLMGIVVPLIAGMLTYYVCEIICIELHHLLVTPKDYYYYELSLNFKDEFYGKPLILQLHRNHILFVFVVTNISLHGFFSAFFQFFSLHFTKNLIFKIVLLMVILTTFISTFIFMVLESLHISENRLFDLVEDWVTSIMGRDINGSETLLFAIPAAFSAVVLWYAGYVRLKEYQLQ